ncbi:hypothetical protein SH1V18_28350 [Vallitalea longa]|uniref:SnoaL-like domain-containing protein n=1 Tax=Vallitalea longa TaxID=2936439 RepID=A0A9W5YAG8_9FIRM|nr:nuclear transport factor 2 family protein [Vallitalea longa]GKX30355.1 hypothetical protein SH1V18_28350 [Vallitalea longa]
MGALLDNNKITVEITKILEKYQKGYTEKNIDNVDSYMKELFIDDDSIITIGTSRSEWCFGLEECKKLIESDWKYWGEFKIDYENAKINSKGNTAWFLSDCIISWDEEEDYNEWCDDLVADYFNENGRFINYNSLSKVAMLNLQLAFILKSATGFRGINVPFPVRLSGVLTNKKNQWFISKLHFSVPMSSYPEWRIDYDNMDSLKYYNQSVQKLKNFQYGTNGQSRKSVIELLSTLKDNYLNKSYNVVDTVINIFSKYEDNYIVDPNENPAAVGKEKIKDLILMQREKWSEMELNINESIIKIEGDTAIIVTNGIFKNNQDSEELIKDEWNNIKDILQKDGKGEDKLFEVQKKIAYTFKEVSFGEKSSWEFRFDAIAIHQDDGWKFHNIQFTYPVLYMLEGNYNMIPLLDKRS